MVRWIRQKIRRWREPSVVKVRIRRSPNWDTDAAKHRKDAGWE